MDIPRRRGIAIWLFALVWVSCIWFGSWPMNPNSATRMFAAVSIVETGRPEIDRFEALTIDKARFGDHFYMDKAPGMTLMAVPFFALAQAIGSTRTDAIPLGLYAPETEAFFKGRMWLTLACTTAVLVALAAVALFDLSLSLTGNVGAALFAALGFALGTPVWGWSTTLFGHAPTTALLVIAAWAVWRGTSENERPHLHATIAGAALGWAVVIEPAAAIVGTPVVLWAIWRMRDRPDRWQVLGVGLAAGIAALIPLAAYNQFAFGTPLRMGYSGVVGFDGMNQGFFGLTYPKPDVLYRITLGGRRGLVWVAPILILALVGFARGWRVAAWREVVVVAPVGAVAALLYNASYVYWDGGLSTGPRHALPAVGFLSIGLVFFWARGGTAWRFVGVMTLALSIAINLMIASAEIFAFGNEGRIALWDAVVMARFVPGYLNTLPGYLANIPPWPALGIYGIVAATLASMLWEKARR